MSASKFAEYRKTATGLVALAVTYASLYYGGNHWVSLAIGVAGALGIYAVPNAPGESTVSALLPFIDEAFKSGRFDKYLPKPIPAQLGSVGGNTGPGYASGYGGSVVGGSSGSGGVGGGGLGSAGGSSASGSGSSLSSVPSVPAPPLPDDATPTDTTPTA
jgi:hypothetical protein